MFSELTCLQVNFEHTESDDGIARFSIAGCFRHVSACQTWCWCSSLPRAFQSRFNRRQPVGSLPFDILDPVRDYRAGSREDSVSAARRADLDQVGGALRMRRGQRRLATELGG